MSLYTISDLHIWGPDDPLYHSLLRLIRERVVNGDTLILAGDIFDLFVGKKEIFTRRYAEFFDALSEAEKRGVKTHYIEGNHDFLLQNVFTSSPSVEVHTKSVEIEIQQKRFFFAHGDLANPRDYSYLFLRSFFRGPFIRAFVKLAPGSWIDRIGKKSSSRSQNYNPRLTSDFPIERIHSIRTIYRSYAAEQIAKGFDFVVLGHCHDLDEMLFNMSGRTGQYINVGFPRAHGSFLSWSPGDEKIQREKLP